MPTLRDVQSAIEHLTPGERQSLAIWLYELGDAEWRVAEAAPAYGNPTRPHRVSVEEYLLLEEGSPNRHEYVAGDIFAMSGASKGHNLIAGNLFAAFRAHLRGGPCRVFMEAVKLRLQAGSDALFYYPDVLVECGNPTAESRYVQEPKLVIEVLSPSTTRTDRVEKAASYRAAATLEEYVLVAQDRPKVAIHRRAEGWQPVVLPSLEDTAAFRSIELSMPLAVIYEDVLK